MLQCVGCGAVIQTDDPKGRGYIPQSALQKNTEQETLYCQRCFKLRHYNQLEKVAVTEDEFLAILNEIGQKDALIVNVIDVFDVSGSLIPGLQRFVGDNPILLVANKMDLLPKSVKPNKIINWLQRYLKEQGLNVGEVFLASAKKRHNIDKLLLQIEKSRQGRDVYVVGVTNVGKSTIINRLLQSTGVDSELITTSQFPGTTLDLIKIPFDESSELIDTPGIIHSGQMTSLLKGKELKLVLPENEIKARTYQLSMGQTLFFAGLGRFDYLAGEKSSFTVYMSNKVNIHRRKLEGADEFYNKHRGELLSPPIGGINDEFPELVRREFTLKKETDIVFAGLGWLLVRNPGKVAVYAPKGIDVLLRDPII